MSAVLFPPRNPSGRRGHMTPAEIEAIVEALRANGGSRALAQAALVRTYGEDRAPSLATIQRHATGAGVDGSATEYGSRQQREVLRLIRDEHLTATEAGRRCGVSGASARRWARGAGLNCSENRVLGGRRRGERLRAQRDEAIDILRRTPALPARAAAALTRTKEATVRRWAHEAGLDRDAARWGHAKAYLRERSLLGVTRRIIEARLRLDERGHRTPWDRVGPLVSRSGEGARNLAQRYGPQLGYDFEELARRAPSTPFRLAA